MQPAAILTALDRPKSGTAVGGKQQSWSTQFPYRSLQSQEAMRRKGLPQAFEGQFTNRFDLC